MQFRVVLSLSGMFFGLQDERHFAVPLNELDDDDVIYSFSCAPIYLEKCGVEHFADDEYSETLTAIRGLLAKAKASDRLNFRKNDDGPNVVNWQGFIDLLGRRGIVITVDAELKRWMNTDDKYHAFRLIAEQAKHLGYTLVRIA